MSRTRVGNILALALLAVAIGLLGWTASIWVRDGKKIEALRAQYEQHEADLKSTRTELVAVGLRYRGFQASRGAMPDSLRKAAKAESKAAEKDLTKNIRRLEVQEYNLGFEMKQIKRREGKAIAERKEHARPFFIGGTGALALAGIVFATTRSRRKPLDARPSAALF